MILAGTGHRPLKLGGYGQETFLQLTHFAESWLLKLKPKSVISGMALGWDQALAQAAVNLSIPFTAAIPFPGQENRWPRASKEQYFELLKSAVEKIEVEPRFSWQAFQSRNKWMVDNCTLLLALWDGSTGGTKNCIDYASSVNREILNIWEAWQNDLMRKGL